MKMTLWICLALSVLLPGRTPVARAQARSAELQPQTGHGGPISSLAFTGERRLVTVGADNRLILWDVAARREIKDVPLGVLASQLTCSPDGRLLAVAGLRDESVLILDAVTMRILKKLPAPSDAPAEVLTGPQGGTRIAWLPGGDGHTLARSYRMKAVVFQSADTGATVFPAIVFPKLIYGLACDPALAEVAVLGSDGPDTNSTVLAVYNAATGERNKISILAARAPLDLYYIARRRLASLTLRQSDVPDVPAGPASDQLTGFIDIWDTGANSAPVSLSGRGFFGRLVPLPNSQFVLPAYDGTLRLYDFALHLLGQTSALPPGQMPLLACSGQQDLLACAAPSGAVQLRSLPGLQTAGVLMPTVAPAAAVASSNDGHCITVADLRGQITVWSVDHAAPIAFVPPGPTTAVALTPTGSYAVIAHADGLIKVWDLTGGAANEPFEPRLAANLSGHKRPACRLAVTPDGTRVASLTSTVASLAFQTQTEEGYVWEVGTGNRLSILPATMGDAVAFRPDGAVLALANSSTGEVTLYDPLTGLARGEPLQGGRGSISLAPSTVAWSPDGHTVALALPSGLTLWNPVDHQIRWQNKETFLWDEPGLTFSPDGGRIAAGSANHGVRILDAANGQPLRAPLQGHSGSVAGYSFLPGGGLVTAGSEGRTILWDTAKGLVAANFFSGKDAASLITLPDFSYANRRNGVGLVGFRIDDQIYPFESLDLVFNRPDQVLSALMQFLPDGGDARVHSLAAEFRAAYERRCDRNGVAASPPGGSPAFNFELPEIKNVALEGAP